MRRSGCPECGGWVRDATPIRRECMEDDCYWDEYTVDMRVLAVQELSPEVIQWYELQQVASIVEGMDGSWNKEKMWKYIHECIKDNKELEIWDALVEVGVCDER